MKVLGLNWVGTKTDRFRETVSFFEKTLGLPIGNERADFVRFDLPDSSCVEVFGPRDTDHPYFTTGPVLGFLVEDIDAARHDLSRHGTELLGRTEGERGDYRWQHFRGPDGYVYEVDEDPARRPVGSPVGPFGITRLMWAGTRTDRYEATRSFFGSVLDLEVAEDFPELTEYRLPDGASVEVFHPGTFLDHPHFTTGPVPGFAVKSLEGSVERLRSRKVPVLQSKQSEDGGWVHFRAPDGCVYELKQ
jgi:catechol 2,3-dioxygenase-like lactoylglutathione lyase family enzyme